MTKAELVEATKTPDILPRDEQRRLFELEQVITTDMAAFLRVGSALAEIRDCRLYRGECLTFPEYLGLRWGIGEAYANRQIKAHTVVKQLGYQDQTTPIGVVLPNNEAQVRPLTKYIDRPEVVAEAWRMATEAAPEGRVTAKLVQMALAEVTGEQVQRKVREAKEKATSNNTLSAEFTAAYDTFMEAIVRAKKAKESTEAMIEYLEAAIEVVNQT